MRKLLVMMLVVITGMILLVGCNAQTSEPEVGQNIGGEDVGSSEEVVSENEVSNTETTETEVSEEVEEITLEEKIFAEMPAKLEVPDGYVPETVTAEQIMARWEEIKVSDVEYAEDINRENLAGLLVLNCSYMEPAEFKSLVDEYFDDNPNNKTDWSSVKELMRNYANYQNYLASDKKFMVLIHQLYPKNYYLMNI